jgi:polysaccharide export outer membrane protein
MTAVRLRLVGASVFAMLAAMPAVAHQEQLPTSSQPATQAQGTSATESAEYRIGAEDVLDILVWKNVELSRTVQVRPDGKISLPLVNDVQAADLTPMQLRDVLSTGYAKYFTAPELSVNVREVHSIKVSVLGMVKTPGRYELKAQATVLEALALAGGFTEFAKRDKVFVSRQAGAEWKRMPFNYLKVLDGNDRENFVLRRGDIIVVP